MIFHVVDAHRRFYESRFRRLGFALTTFSPGGASIWYRWTDATTAVIRPETNCVPTYHRHGRKLTTDQVIEMYLQLRNEEADRC